MAKMQESDLRNNGCYGGTCEIPRWNPKIKIGSRQDVAACADQYGKHSHKGESLTVDKVV